MDTFGMLRKGSGTTIKWLSYNLDTGRYRIFSPGEAMGIMVGLQGEGGCKVWISLQAVFRNPFSPFWPCPESAVVISNEGGKGEEASLGGSLGHGKWSRWGLNLKSCSPSLIHCYIWANQKTLECSKPSDLWGRKPYANKWALKIKRRCFLLFLKQLLLK